MLFSTLLYNSSFQCRCILFLPRLPSGSGSEVVIAADVPKVAVTVDKVVVDVEVGCANEYWDALCSTSQINLGYVNTVTCTLSFFPLLIQQ